MNAYVARKKPLVSGEWFFAFYGIFSSVADYSTGSMPMTPGTSSMSARSMPS